MIVSEAYTLLAGTASLTPGVRIALFALIGLLLVTLGFLAAVALGMQRRATPEPTRAPASRRTPPSGFAAVAATDLMLVRSTHTGEEVAVDASGGAVACRTCRREYAAELSYCPRDARRLVPASEIDAGQKGGSVCPGCRRTFDPGVRFCPHDAAELLPVSLYEVTRGEISSSSSTGVLGKICPQCRGRYDFAATFCGKDGSELVVIN